MVEWLVDEGAEVAVGDEVAEVETEKINGAVEEPGRRACCAAAWPARATSIPVGGLLGVVRRRRESATPRSTPSSKSSRPRSCPARPRRTPARSPRPSRVGAGTLRYLRQGEGGEPIVLLHGFGGDLNNWLFNVEPLSAERTVYALDLPGHGGSIEGRRAPATRRCWSVPCSSSSTASTSSARTSSATRSAALVAAELALARSRPRALAHADGGGRASARRSTRDYIDGFVAAEQQARAQARAGAAVRRREAGRRARW